MTMKLYITRFQVQGSVQINKCLFSLTARCNLFFATEGVFSFVKSVRQKVYLAFPLLKHSQTSC